MQKILTVLALGGILAFGTPDAVQAQEQDGLVNINIGDITIEDINIAVAAQIIANVCANVDVDAALALLGAIDDSPTGTTEQVCRIGRRGQGPELTVTQN